MAACWRELAGREGVDLLVFAVQKNLEASEFEYDEHVADGFNCQKIDIRQSSTAALVETLIKAHNPDIMFYCGWSIPAYVRLLTNRSLTKSKKVMTMDTNLKRDWRQFFAPFKIGKYLRRMDVIFVPGERSSQLAKYWGIPETKIRKGSYAMDYNGFAKAYECRAREPQWPKAFLFAGQYIERKGIRHLLSAYSAYRKNVESPWPLVVCGSGPLEGLLLEAAGVSDLGFVQPAQLPAVFEKAGVFVYPSLFDPWGVAIAEACAAGLPVLCTDACGASVELIRDYYNGLTLPGGDDKALTSAMSWMHRHYEWMPAMGANSQALAMPYSAEAWANRVLSIVNDVCV